MHFVDANKNKGRAGTSFASSIHRNCSPAGFGQKGNVMNCWRISAQFAAYIWRLQEKTGQPVSSREAARFARDNWVAFLPYADEGIGKLLIAIARPGRKELLGRSRVLGTRRRKAGSNNKVGCG
jgi:hypothetical protein